MTTFIESETTRFLDAGAAAALLGIGRGTLYNLRSADQFAPAIRIGRALRWEAGALLDWARAQNEEVAA